MKNKSGNKKGAKGIYFSTGLVWNSIWSHSHELASQLAKHRKIFYFEVPQLTNPSHEVLVAKNNFAIPENMCLLGSKKKFQSASVSYFIEFMKKSIRNFMKNKGRFSNYIIYNIYDIAGLFLARRYRKKIIFIFADEYNELTEFPAFIKIYLRWAQKQFLKKANVVICTAKKLQLKAKKFNKNAVYLPNAVNLEDKKQIPKSVKKNKKFTAGFVGSLGSWVDIESMIFAAKELKDVQFNIIGSGERFNELESTVKKLSLGNMKLFGYVTHKDIYKEMKRFDVAVIPFKINKITNSLSPVKLFEYWLVKKPVICSKTYELSQFKDKVLFANDGSALVKQIERLKKDKKLLGRLGSEGNKLVKERFNWSEYMKIYKKILK